MEIAVIKIVLAGAFFVTIVTAAYWAGDKLNEYKEYWDDEQK